MACCGLPGWACCWARLYREILSSKQQLSSRATSAQLSSMFFLPSIVLLMMTLPVSTLQIYWFALSMVFAVGLCMPRGAVGGAGHRGVWPPCIEINGSLVVVIGIAIAADVEFG